LPGKNPGRTDGWKGVRLRWRRKRDAGYKKS